MESLTSEDIVGVVLAACVAVVLGPGIAILLISECRTFGRELGETEERTNMLSRQLDAKFDAIRGDLGEMRLRARKLCMRVSSAEGSLGALLGCFPTRPISSDSKNDTQTGA